MLCANTFFLVRALRIHPVQSVVDNPTQLSGRGFPCIFYIEVVVTVRDAEPAPRRTKRPRAECEGRPAPAAEPCSSSSLEHVQPWTPAAPGQGQPNALALLACGLARGKPPHCSTALTSLAKDSAQALAASQLLSGLSNSTSACDSDLGLARLLPPSWGLVNVNWCTAVGTVGGGHLLC